MYDGLLDLFATSLNSVVRRTWSEKMSLRSSVAAVPQLNLAKTRERRGISLKQISDSTKISVRFLQAIESEEFDQLPGGIFSTSYIRQYSQAIGIEEARVLAVYNGRMGVQIQPDHKENASETLFLSRHAAGR
jgi:transcriptional regulator with XRE-family HTH domain